MQKIKNKSTAGNNSFSHEQLQALEDMALGKAMQGMFNSTDIITDVFNDLVAAGYSGTFDEISNVLESSHEWKVVQLNNLETHCAQSSDRIMSKIKKIVVDFYTERKLDYQYENLKDILMRELDLSDADAADIAKIIYEDQSIQSISQQIKKY